MTDGILFDNIYLGTSEKDLEQFIAETYAVKAPVEQALEAADKAKEEAEAAKGKKTSSSNTDEPDMKADPVGWAKFKAQQFLDEALANPKKALVERPLTGGVLGVVFATLIGMLGVGTSLPPSPFPFDTCPLLRASYQADSICVPCSPLAHHARFCCRRRRPESEEASPGRRATSRRQGRRGGRPGQGGGARRRGGRAGARGCRGGADEGYAGEGCGAGECQGGGELLGHPVRLSTTTASPSRHLSVAGAALGRRSSAFDDGRS